MGFFPLMFLHLIHSLFPRCCFFFSYLHWILAIRCSFTLLVHMFKNRTFESVYFIWGDYDKRILGFFLWLFRFSRVECKHLGARIWGAKLEKIVTYFTFSINVPLDVPVFSKVALSVVLCRVFSSRSLLGPTLTFPRRETFQMLLKMKEVVDWLCVSRGGDLRN